MAPGGFVTGAELALGSTMLSFAYGNFGDFTLWELGIFYRLAL